MGQPRHATVATQEAVVLTRRAAYASVGVAVTLIGLKGWAWVASGSVAMLAALTDSILDLAASLFTLFAVRYAAAPPDAEHRFGHGKAEAFAGLVQAGLVAVSAALLLVEVVRRALDPTPQPVQAGALALAVTGVAIVLTAALIAYQSWTLRRTGSVATAGDRAHYLSDLLSNAVVALGVAAGAFGGFPQADAVAGLFVALWLGQGAWSVARDAADHLMDHELPETDREAIAALAAADPQVLAVHDLRTRASGPYIHIQFHADLDPALSLAQAHAIVVAAEARIRAAYPAADIIIHPDPKDVAEPHGHESFLEGGRAPAG